MPFNSTGYAPYSKSDIETALRERFEDNVGAQAGPVLDDLIETEAAVLVDFQEQAMSELYDAAFIELASDEELTMKSRENGIIRRDARPASGVARFDSDGPVIADRAIPLGTEIQTDELEPVSFETLEEEIIEYISGFESSLSSDWAGSTGDYSTTNTHPYDGDGELTVGAVSGSHIYNEATNFKRGSTVHNHVYHETSTVAGTTVCVGNAGDDRYQVVTDVGSSELRLELVTGGGTPTVLDASAVSVPTGEYIEKEISFDVDYTLSAALLDSNGNTLATVSDTDTTLESGYVGVISLDANNSKYWDEFAESSVGADIRATEGGNHTNLSKNSITTFVNSITNVQSVTNPAPTGDDSYYLLDGTSFIAGRNRETDDNLRERALSSLSGGGAATRGAIYTAVSNIDDVNSLNVIVNSEDVDNTGTGGLPPYSSEVVVYGGELSEIVESMYDVMSFVDFLRLYAGAHGTEETYDVYDEVVDDTFTGRISRPPKVGLEVDITIVTEDGYAGDNTVEDAILDYVGGIARDEERVIGLGVGDDVFKSKITSNVTSIGGVVGVTDLVLDTDGDGTDDTTTNSDGLDVIDVGDNEVAQVDLSNDAITIITN